MDRARRVSTSGGSWSYDSTASGPQAGVIKGLEGGGFDREPRQVDLLESAEVPLVDRGGTHTWPASATYQALLRFYCLTFH